MDLQKRTWAEIDLGAIKYNYKIIRSLIPDSCKFLGVVKADAYGHGAVEVSRCLEELGAEYLAVSCLDEALELRNADITLPILILGHTPPEYTKLLCDNDLTQTVTCEAKAIEYSNMARRLGKTLKIHIKVDTGMSRLGFLCDGDYFEKGAANIAAAVSKPCLEPEGIYTHFAASDEDNDYGREFTEKQFSLFRAVLDELQKKYNINFKICHCANSGAVVNYKETALDMVRPGILLYGYGDGGKLGLAPCMRLLTRVSTIKFYEPDTPISYGGICRTKRRTRIGVLPIGYADGLMRSLSNKCEFYAGDGFAPQCGRICMDMCMVDLTERPEVGIDTQVEIFGSRAGLQKLADEAGTIPYELLCAVSRRVPRVYMR